MKSQFVDNLILIRKHFKLSYERMEDVFGCGSAKTQGNYVNGDTEPSYQYLMKVSEYCGISMDRLCYEEIKAIDLPERPYRPIQAIGEQKKVASAMILSKKELIDVSGLLEELTLLKDRITALEGRIKQLESENI